MEALSLSLAIIGCYAIYTWSAYLKRRESFQHAVADVQQMQQLLLSEHTKLKQATEDCLKMRDDLNTVLIQNGFKPKGHQ